MIRASSAGRSFRWSALAQMSETCPRATPAAASSPSTASMAIVRIGPYEGTVASSNAIVTRERGFTSSPRRGRPIGCASASPTAVVRSLTGAGTTASLFENTRVRSGSVAVRVVSP